MSETAINATKARFRTMQEQREHLERMKQIKQVASNTVQYLNKIIDEIKKVRE